MVLQFQVIYGTLQVTQLLSKQPFTNEEKSRRPLENLNARRLLHPMRCLEYAEVAWSYHPPLVLYEKPTRLTVRHRHQCQNEKPGPRELLDGDLHQPLSRNGYRNSVLWRRIGEQRMALRALKGRLVNIGLWRWP